MTLVLPPHDLECQAVQLSADIYLPMAQLQAKYPSAIIREAGCDRFMVWKCFPYIFVVFMGTHDFWSLLSDFDMKRHRASIGHGEVHEGFDQGVEELWSDLLAAIHSLGDGDCFLVWTGHSRGATQTIMSAGRYAAWVELRDDPPVTKTRWILPIAPARPGDAVYRNWYNSLLGDVTFCYTHGADIVPWESPYVLGNRGVGHRVWFPDLVAPGATAPRMLDPSLGQLLPGCSELTIRGWVNRPRQFEQLSDHRVVEYCNMIQGAVTASK